MTAWELLESLQKYYGRHYNEEQVKVMVAAIEREFDPKALEQVLSDCYMTLNRLPLLSDLVKWCPKRLKPDSSYDDFQAGAKPECDACLDIRWICVRQEDGSSIATPCPCRKRGES